MTKTIKTEQYYIRANFNTDSVNEEDRTIELTFATNAPYQRYIWAERGPELVNEILVFDRRSVRMERLNNSAPFLDNHNRFGSIKDNVLGVVENAWLEKNEGRAIVRFSKRDNAQEIFEDVKDGILKNVSVGYKVFKYERERGEDIDTLRAVDWEPMEISLVDVPADFNAQVRSEDNAKVETQIINENKEERQEEKTAIPNTYYADLRIKI